MNKTELLAQAQTILDIQLSWNGHEHTDGAGRSYLAYHWHPGKDGLAAWGHAQMVIKRILSELYGSDERAERIMEGVYDSNENIAYVVREIRELDHYKSACQCEYEDHFDDPRFGIPSTHGYQKVNAGNNTAKHVGLVCDECAKTHMAEHII